MKLTNVEIKSTDSPLLHVNAEFVTIRDAYSVGRYLGELVKRNVDVEIVHKSNNCCKPTTQPEMPVPEKIFRCGDTTTVIWKDGTKTIVKLMPGADDSDYGAFTAALAKKIYGNNSKVMRYAGMVQKVKSKAEKKAERKAKHKAEPEESGEKRYVVTQYGEVAEYKGDDDRPFENGHVVMVFAKTHDEAIEKAYAYFAYTDFELFVVYSDGRVEKEHGANLVRYFGAWRESLAYNNRFVTAVFAKSQEEALVVLEINPAPKEGEEVKRITQHFKDVLAGIGQIDRA